PVIAKMTFDAVRAPGFLNRLPPRPDVVVAGCEAHVCVLQTVLGLLAAGQRVFVVRDAIGARRAESKETAIGRMARHGAEIVTAEMVVFEWLGTAEHPRFRAAISLVK
ncbi:MAG TPA: isochorismatase family protein, partial [Acetobacteraceae bacterium]|nr:isochorismatase family protein [Acetobacteraceae bacterium]